jgi:hypothetical protein
MKVLLGIEIAVTFALVIGHLIAVVGGHLERLTD